MQDPSYNQLPRVQNYGFCRHFDRCALLITTPLVLAAPSQMMTLLCPQLWFGIAAATTFDNGMTATAGIDFDEVMKTSQMTWLDTGGDWGTLKFGGYAEAEAGGCPST